MADGVARKDSVSAEVEELTTVFRRPLLSYFTRRIGNPAEAEDLTQEVFFRILRRQEPGEIEHKSGFIFTAAANLLRDRARQRCGRPPPVELPAAEAEPSLIEDCSQERVLIARERLVEVMAYLDELEPKVRDAFLMFRVDRMRQGEIAKALGMSVSSVEKYVARATAHLVERLQLGREDGANDGA
ncbi:MAG: sigma-70 family RNA polymerase sigma factor [Acetobacteraceae bacterium]|nr:sigma-70 family RNA polymerase sigma factor [Acetobacteraceae bacterium]